MDNMLVQLVGLTSNNMSTFICHSILYYCVMCNISYRQIVDLYINFVFPGRLLSSLEIDNFIVNDI